LIIFETSIRNIGALIVNITVFDLIELFKTELSKLYYIVEKWRNDSLNMESLNEILSENGQFLQYHIIIFFFVVLIKSCLLQDLDPLFGSQVKNKQHLHSRQLAFYLVYGSEGMVQAYSRETGISESNHNRLIVGLVGETIRS
jgi:hypothetical protein